MSKCKQCGAENPNSAYYCGRCGNSLYSTGREVVPKGTRRAQQELEEKYVAHPTVGTGFIVLWRAISRLFSRPWKSVGEFFVDSWATILILVGVVVYFWITILIAERNSIDKYSVLSNNGNYSLFKKEKQLTPYQYDTIILCSSGGDLSFAIVKQSGKYGRIDRKGQVLDSCLYDWISSFKQGWAITESNGLFGFIKEQKKGKLQAVKPQFIDAHSFSEGFARVQYADKTYGWIDSNGYEVPWGKVYSCGEYSNGLAWISIDGSGKEYGYVDKKGNITNLHATGATQFINDRAFISKGGAWAMIDRNLSSITDYVLQPRVDPATKKFLKPYFKFENDKKCWQCSYNGRDCYINKKGEILNGDQVAQVSAKKKGLYTTKRDSVSYLMGINFGSFIKVNGFGDIKWNRVSKGITDYVNSTGNRNSVEFEKQFEMSPSLINNVLNSYLSDRGKGIKGSRARRDSVAYLLGLNFGTILKNNHFGALDNQIIKTGVDDYMSAKGDPKDSISFLAQFRVNANKMKPVFNSYLAERTAQIAHANLQKENAFMSDNKGKQGVIASPSGLQYTILNSGNTSRRPKKNSDTVYVKYTGKLLDGSIFDETSGTEDVHFLLSRVIKGWQEGLKRVGEGGSIRLFIPAKLAYGDKWNGNIEPNSTLIFDIQLSRVVYGR